MYSSFKQLRDWLRYYRYHDMIGALKASFVERATTACLVTKKKSQDSGPIHRLSATFLWTKKLIIQRKMT